MVGGEDARPVGGEVLTPDARQAEVEAEERLQDRPHRPVDERVDPAGARALEIGGAVHCLGVPGCATLVTVGTRPMAFDRAQTLRGALAGAVAAGVWAAQQPLDKRVFGFDYDDTELLGKLVTRNAAWVPVGAALHVANGAALGALYAN